MKRLTSKQEEKRKQKRNQILVGIILIGVLVVSVFGIFINSFGQNKNNEIISYKNYDFIKQNDLWYTQIGEKQFVFLYNPLKIQKFLKNSSEIKIQGKIKSLNSYLDKPLYVYSEDYNSKSEIYRNFYGKVLRMQDACPSENITKTF